MTPNFFNMSAPIESENDPDTLSDEVKKRSWMVIYAVTCIENSQILIKPPFLA